MPDRRIGENRVISIVEDIFELLLYLDAKKLLDKLPLYVTDNPDCLPSLRFHEGDLLVIMTVLGRLDSKTAAHDSVLTAN